MTTPTEEKIRLDDFLPGDTARTLLIPLWCRATPCRLNPEAAYDPLAARILARLDCDFRGVPESATEYARLACLAREYRVDGAVRRFVAAHPAGVIVNLGCGLSTAAWRVPLADCLWYDLDLPEVVRAREALLPAEGPRALIGASLLDPAWTDAVARQEDPAALFIAAGVFQYFREEELMPALARLAERFPGGRVRFDATSALGLRWANRFVRGAGIRNAEMHFAVDEAQALARWSPRFRVREEPFFAEVPRKGLSPITRACLFVAEHLGRHGMAKWVGIDFAEAEGEG